MRVAVFFACLCILLLRGDGYIHTGAHYNSICYTPVLHTEKAQQVKGTDQYDTVIQNIYPDKNEDLLVDDDVNDEDPNTLIARKYRLLATYYLLPDHQFTVRDLHTYARTPQNFCNPLSNKYITQKVLRI